MKKRSQQENLILKGDIYNETTNPRNEVFLILDNIRSMNNVGAIFRTSDAAHIKSLFLCGVTACPPRSQISKTALGTENSVPWKYYNSTLRLVKILKSKGVQVIALEQTNQSVDYKEFNYKKPIAIVLGNEIDGVSDKVLAACDGAIEIPMRGIANSLNVSTSAGIIIFEAIK